MIFEIIIIILIIIYLGFVFLFFRAISYHCVMGMYGYKKYTFTNFIIALFFPVYLIFLFIWEKIENYRYSKEEQFEKFKKKRIKEYKNLTIKNKGNFI